VRAQVAALLESEAPEVAAKLRTPARRHAGTPAAASLASVIGRLPDGGGGRTIRLVPG
jgi:hypothetical protein